MSIGQEQIVSVNQPITFGDIQNPLQIYTYVIPAGGIEKVYFTHDYFRILACDIPADLRIRFGASGQDTTMPAGVGFKIPFAIPVVQLRNVGVAPITVTLALAMGFISDDRLNVSGNLNIVTPPGTYLATQPRNPSAMSNAQVSFLANTATQIIASNAVNRHSVLVTAPASTDLFIGTSNAVTVANGTRVPAGSSLTLYNTGAIWGITTPASTVTYLEETY